LNEQDGSFSDAGIDLVSGWRSRVSCADVDKDGDLDFLVGCYSTAPTTLYRNNMNFPKVAPGPPQSLQSENSGMGVILDWEPPQNFAGSQSFLTYNIRLGSTSLSADIISPMTLSPSSSIRLISQMGNAQTNTGWKIDSLPVGDYYWSVQAIDNSFFGGDWSAEKSFTITQMRPFFSTDSVCLGESNLFTDQTIVSGTEIAEWLWDFGDGNSSVMQHPGHVYDQAGSYDVQLTVTDTAGVSLTKTNPVFVRPVPEANFSSDIVCDEEETTFSNTTNTTGLAISQWSWNFGDGTSSNQQDPGSHRYFSAGEYTVDLIVNAENGCSSILSKTATVGALPIVGVTADGKVKFCEGESLTLTNYETNPTYLYRWQLGGAEQTGGDSSSFVATIGGEYRVTVTNPAGNCVRISAGLTVTVAEIPGTPVIRSENYMMDACQDEDPITLSVKTEETDANYYWSIDGTPISGATGSSLTGYLEEGNYRVVAMTKDSTCEMESEVLTIEYAHMPDPPELIAEGPNVWYLACSNDSATAYKWFLNGELIGGADDYLYVAGSQEGKFEVAISVNGSCFAKSDPVWIPLGTGIDVNPWENLKIYPNPTPGLFTLEMNNHIMGDLIIDIFGETGAQIINIKFHKETAHFRTQIDLSGQPSGAYLIGLMLEQYRANRTLIVE